MGAYEDAINQIQTGHVATATPATPPSPPFDLGKVTDAISDAIQAGQAGIKGGAAEGTQNILNATIASANQANSMLKPMNQQQPMQPSQKLAMPDLFGMARMGVGAANMMQGKSPTAQMPPVDISRTQLGALFGLSPAAQHEIGSVNPAVEGVGKFLGEQAPYLPLGLATTAAAPEVEALTKLLGSPLRGSVAASGIQGGIGGGTTSALANLGQQSTSGKPFNVGDFLANTGVGTLFGAGLGAGGRLLGAAGKAIHQNKFNAKVRQQLPLARVAREQQRLKQLTNLKRLDRIEEQGNILTDSEKQQQEALRRQLNLSPSERALSPKEQAEALDLKKKRATASKEQSNAATAAIRARYEEPKLRGYVEKQSVQTEHIIQNDRALHALRASRQALDELREGRAGRASERAEEKHPLEVENLELRNEEIQQRLESKKKVDNDPIPKQEQSWAEYYNQGARPLTKEEDDGFIPVMAEFKVALNTAQAILKAQIKKYFAETGILPATRESVNARQAAELSELYRKLVEAGEADVVNTRDELRADILHPITVPDLPVRGVIDHADIKESLDHIWKLEAEVEAAEKDYKSFKEEVKEGIPDKSRLRVRVGDNTVVVTRHVIPTKVKPKTTTAAALIEEAQARKKTTTKPNYKVGGVAKAHELEDNREIVDSLVAAGVPMSRPKIKGGRSQSGAIGPHKARRALNATLHAYDELGIEPEAGDELTRVVKAVMAIDKHGKAPTAILQRIAFSQITTDVINQLDKTFTQTRGRLILDCHLLMQGLPKAENWKFGKSVEVDTSKWTMAQKNKLDQIETNLDNLKLITKREMDRIGEPKEWLDLAAGQGRIYRALEGDLIMLTGKGESAGEKMGNQAYRYFGSVFNQEFFGGAQYLGILHMLETVNSNLVLHAEYVPAAVENLASSPALRKCFTLFSTPGIQERATDGSSGPLGFIQKVLNDDVQKVVEKIPGGKMAWQLWTATGYERGKQGLTASIAITRVAMDSKYPGGIEGLAGDLVRVSDGHKPRFPAQYATAAYDVYRWVDLTVRFSPEGPIQPLNWFQRHGMLKMFGVWVSPKIQGLRVAAYSGDLCLQGIRERNGLKATRGLAGLATSVAVTAFHSGELILPFYCWKLFYDMTNIIPDRDTRHWMHNALDVTRKSAEAIRHTNPTGRAATELSAPPFVPAMANDPLIVHQLRASWDDLNKIRKGDPWAVGDLVVDLAGLAKWTKTGGWGNKRILMTTKDYLEGVSGELTRKIFTSVSPVQRALNKRNELLGTYRHGKMSPAESLGNTMLPGIPTKAMDKTAAAMEPKLR